MISSNIKTAREHNGLSQAKLATALGVRENTVWRWENDRATPSANALMKIAEILNTTPAMLLSSNGEDNYKQLTLFPTRSNHDGERTFTYTFINGEKAEFPATDKGYALFEKLRLQKEGQNYPLVAAAPA